MKIPDELDARLRHEAARRGCTISALTREALEAYLGVDRARTPGFVALGASSQSDVSERIEEILREEWGRRG